MTEYIGRFAPSPTGELHIGSLIGAVASYLDAKANQGKWLLRMEDLDPPREVPGAASAILRSLEDHGLHWDGAVLWQSHRHKAYQSTIEQLLATDHAFFCQCSRSQLKKTNGIYLGTCRGQLSPPTGREYAIRMQVPAATISFNDLIQGHCAQQLQQELGDFVLKRKDGLFAYQLAVVVDDAEQGISHIVRGSDLLDSTPRQIYLQRALNLPQPDYAHVPVITNRQGQKLSKQTFAPALLANQAASNLITALRFLQQPLPPSELQQPEQILAWAQRHWSLSRIPALLQIEQVEQNSEPV